MAERKTLDYVILAGLLREARSGYDLGGWVAGEASHFYSVGHSSIYPALGRLEREGLVRHEVIPSEKGPERKVYSLTEAGREAVLQWSQQPGATREVRDEQLVKALCYGYLPAERVLARLREEKAIHLRKLEMYEGFAHALKAHLETGAITRQAYLGTLLTLRRGIGAEQSYVAWCNEAARMLASEDIGAGHPRSASDAAHQGGTN